MKKLIKALIKTIDMAKPVLIQLSDQQFTDTSLPPYYSCIGTHFRHILDFYRCIDEGLATSEVDLTARHRNSEVEFSCGAAISHLEELRKKIKEWAVFPSDKKIWVTDDLGDGRQRLEYTFAALAAQANSHTIHHFALINFMLNQMGIAIAESGFGYNPTTPKQDNFNLTDLN